MQIYDDKLITNQLLRKAGLDVARSSIIEGRTLSGLPESFPVMLKPIRGRGSAGVTLVADKASLISVIDTWLKSGDFGDQFMVEEVLPGTEITITVLPKGEYRIGGRPKTEPSSWALPPVKRFNHVGLVAPYNGAVAVTKNSSVLSESETAVPAVQRAIKQCELVSDFTKAKSPIRIDCRQNAQGEYMMFDVNMKPNMTGAGRPGRDDQDSLSALAARAIGWSYEDFLENILINSWKPGLAPTKDFTK